MRRLERHSAILALCLLAAPCISARAMQNVAPDTAAHAAMPVVPPVSMVDAAAQSPMAQGALTPAGVTRRMNAADQSAQRNVPEARLFQTDGSKNPAMMIVGGAAFLVGAVVGGRAGTVVMIGGGILGLVGLWNYLQ
jgi:hypothetical protein